LEQAQVPLALAAYAWLPKIVLAADENTERDTLIVVFLRGGMDGLTTVVPYGDPNLYSPGLRPTIVVPPPGSPNGAVDLDGFFGLAPAMGPLLGAYQSGQLALVHATGSPDPTRSHFDAFSYMEYGIPQQPLSIFTGWLARHLQSVPPISTNGLRAVAIADVVPRTLEGAPSTVPIADPRNYGFPGHTATATARGDRIGVSYAAAGEPLASVAEDTLVTIDLLKTIDFANYVPAPGAVYPQTSLGTSMKSLAAMVKAEIGLEAATVELSGWDTHNEQGVFQGAMATLMDNLSRSLAAFHVDLQNQMNRLTVVVMSEFGRRADENGSLGTDHGHGNCMMVMGGHVDGGQVFANWTSGELLHPDLLYQGDSLQVTTDYRDVLSEILQKRVQNHDLANVFPNFMPAFPGIVM
jgi:uncharacterized protein (DUF1501 family)